MPNSTIATCLFLVFVAGGPGVTAPPPGAATGPLLWHDPGPLGSKDLYWGAASADTSPRPPFTFVKEDTSGTKPKVQVSDENGTLWVAKFASKSKTGTEVHAEIAASRLLWAFGYFVEEHYFVGEGKIVGVQLGRRRLPRGRERRRLQSRPFRTAAARDLASRPLGSRQQSLHRIPRIVRPQDLGHAPQQLGMHVRETPASCTSRQKPAEPKSGACCRMWVRRSDEWEAPTAKGRVGTSRSTKAATLFGAASATRWNSAMDRSCHRP